MPGLRIAPTVSAATVRRRNGLLPDVPNVAEAGLRGAESSSWGAIMAPAVTPDPVVARLCARLSARRACRRGSLSPASMPPRRAPPNSPASSARKPREAARSCASEVFAPSDLRANVTTQSDLGCVVVMASPDAPSWHVQRQWHRVKVHYRCADVPRRHAHAVVRLHMAVQHEGDAAGVERGVGEVPPPRRAPDAATLAIAPGPRLGRSQLVYCTSITAARLYARASSGRWQVHPIGWRPSSSVRLRSAARAHRRRGGRCRAD